MITMADTVRQMQDRDSMLRRALERIIQLYTDKSHFIFEILQNAEDAKASTICFRQFDTCLEVLHDGTPFTEANLRALCDIGDSDKVDDYNKIGEFGVGFKSVFGICEKVQLFSSAQRSKHAGAYRDFAVEICDFITPVDIEFDAALLKSAYTTKFVFPYCVGKNFSGYKDIATLKAAITQRLTNLGIETLLFMHNLRSIEYDINCDGINASGCYMLDVKEITPFCSKISALSETNERNEELSYLKYSERIPWLEGDRNTIDIAYPIRERDGQCTFVPANSPYISVYFPTETESKLSFIVQGPYRTTPNRSSIPFDDEDNIRLANLSADLLKRSIRDIKDQGLLNLQFLELLPLYAPDKISNWLFAPLYNAIRDLFETDLILPTYDGGFTYAEYAKIARSQDLITLFSNDLLSTLINEEKEEYYDEDDVNISDEDGCIVRYSWLPSQLTDTNKSLSNIYQFLTEVIKIEVIRPDNLREYFYGNDEFWLERDDEWLTAFYRFLEKTPSLLNPTSFDRNLLSIPFVKTVKGTFVAPYRRVSNRLMPNVFLPMAKMPDGIRFVDPQLVERCSNFFIGVLKLTSPDEYEYFKKQLLKRYSRELAFVSDSEHVDDMKSICRYLSEGKYENDMRQAVEDVPFIRCISEKGESYENPRKVRIYFDMTDERVSARDYFVSICEDVHIVDMEFYAKHGINRAMLSQVGVRVSLITGKEDRRDWYTTWDSGNAMWKDENDFRSLLNFSNIDQVIKYVEFGAERDAAKLKSNIIMKLLFKVERHLVGEITKGKTVNAREPARAAIVDALTDGRSPYQRVHPRWLFSADGRLVNPAEISKYDLNIDVYGELRENSSVYSILGFAKTKKDEIAEITKRVFQGDSKSQDDLLDRLLRERLGVSLMEAERKIDVAECYEAERVSRSIELDEETYAQGSFDFPTRPVRNIEYLKKHVMQSVLFADPVTYTPVARSIRTSKDVASVRIYLASMYGYSDYQRQQACQMCKKPTSHFEAVQLEELPKLELEQMHLCLCPACAAKFREYRRNHSTMKEFCQKIIDADCSQDEPVVITIGIGQDTCFTQTHLAEIQQVMYLQSSYEK